MTDWTQKLGLDLFLLAVVNSYWFIGVAFFAIRVALKGLPHAERLKKMNSRVIPRWLLEYGYWQLGMQAKVFQVLGFTPDMVTVLSLLLAIAGAVLIGLGSFGLGGWLMFLSFFCDAFDGILARELGIASDRGEFFDSVIDRYADTITGLGFLYFYRSDPIGGPAAALVIIGSTVMGYAKAKGEAYGVDPNVGIMQRHERAFYLGASTVLAPFAAYFLEPGAAHPRYHLTLLALVAVAFFTNLTSIWRIGYVMKRMPKPTPKPKQAAPLVEEQAGELAEVVALTPIAASAHANGHAKVIRP